MKWFFQPALVILSFFGFFLNVKSMEKERFLSLPGRMRKKAFKSFADKKHSLQDRKHSSTYYSDIANNQTNDTEINGSTGNSSADLNNKNVIDLGLVKKLSDEGSFKSHMKNIESTIPASQGTRTVLNPKATPHNPTVLYPSSVTPDGLYAFVPHFSSNPYDPVVYGFVPLIPKSLIMHPLAPGGIFANQKNAKYLESTRQKQNQDVTSSDMQHRIPGEINAPWSFELSSPLDMPNYIYNQEHDTVTPNDRVTYAVHEKMDMHLIANEQSNETRISDSTENSSADLKKKSHNDQRPRLSRKAKEASKQASAPVKKYKILKTNTNIASNTNAIPLEQKLFFNASEKLNTLFARSVLNHKDFELFYQDFQKSNQLQNEVRDPLVRIISNGTDDVGSLNSDELKAFIVYCHCKNSFKNLNDYYMQCDDYTKSCINTESKNSFITRALSLLRQDVAVAEKDVTGLDMDFKEIIERNNLLTEEDKTKLQAHLFNVQKKLEDQVKKRAKHQVKHKKVQQKADHAGEVSVKKVVVKELKQTIKSQKKPKEEGVNNNEAINKELKKEWNQLMNAAPNKQKSLYKDYIQKLKKNNIDGTTINSDFCFSLYGTKKAVNVSGSTQENIITLIVEKNSIPMQQLTDSQIKALWIYAHYNNKYSLIFPYKDQLRTSCKKIVDEKYENYQKKLERIWNKVELSAQEAKQFIEQYKDFLSMSVNDDERVKNFLANPLTENLSLYNDIKVLEQYVAEALNGTSSLNKIIEKIKGLKGIGAYWEGCRYLALAKITPTDSVEAIKSCAGWATHYLENVDYSSQIDQELNILQAYLACIKGGEQKESEQVAKCRTRMNEHLMVVFCGKDSALSFQTFPVLEFLRNYFDNLYRANKDNTDDQALRSNYLYMRLHWNIKEHKQHVQEALKRLIKSNYYPALLFRATQIGTGLGSVHDDLSILQRLSTQQEFKGLDEHQELIDADRNLVMEWIQNQIRSSSTPIVFFFYALPCAQRWNSEKRRYDEELMKCFFSNRFMFIAQEEFDLLRRTDVLFKLDDSSLTKSFKKDYDTDIKLLMLLWKSLSGNDSYQDNMKWLENECHLYKKPLYRFVKNIVLRDIQLDFNQKTVFYDQINADLIWDHDWCFINYMRDFPNSVEIRMKNINRSTNLKNVDLPIYEKVACCALGYFIRRFDACDIDCSYFSSFYYYFMCQQNKQAKINEYLFTPFIKRVLMQFLTDKAPLFIQKIMIADTVWPKALITYAEILKKHPEDIINCWKELDDCYAKDKGTHENIVGILSRVLFLLDVEVEQFRLGKSNTPLTDEVWEGIYKGLELYLNPSKNVLKTWKNLNTSNPDAINQVVNLLMASCLFYISDLSTYQTYSYIIEKIYYTYVDFLPSNIPYENRKFFHRNIVECWNKINFSQNDFNLQKLLVKDCNLFTQSMSQKCSKNILFLEMNKKIAQTTIMGVLLKEIREIFKNQKTHAVNKTKKKK